MASPFLLLSFSIAPGASAARQAVTDALAFHTFAWMVKHVAAVVKVPTLTEVETVIDRMIAIEQLFAPDVTCVAVLVPHKQAHWAITDYDDGVGVKAIIGRESE